MKNKLSKAVAAILIIATALSMASVFAFAAEEEATQSTLESLVCRSFDEGWDYDNGLIDFAKNQEFKIDYEEKADFTYNYFLRMTSRNITIGTDGHVAITPGVQLTGGLVVELDVKTDSLCNFSRLAYLMTDSSSDKRTNIGLFAIQNNVLKILGNEPMVTADTKNTWVHIAFVFRIDQSLAHCVTSGCGAYYDRDESATCPGCGKDIFKNVLQMRTYVSNKDAWDYENAYDLKSLPAGHEVSYSENTYYYDQLIDMNAGQPAQIYTLRFGFEDNKAEEKLGQGWCLDNFVAYRDTAPKDSEGNPTQMTIVDDISDIEKYGYGKLVSKNKAKTIPILGGEEIVDYLGTGIVMKIGSDYMLAKKAREPIFTNLQTGKAYGAPVKIDGVVYVPFEQILALSGYPSYVHQDGITYDISSASGSASLTIGRDTAVINGKRTALYKAPIIVADPDDPENTYPVIAKEDVNLLFGNYYADYDEMGLIAITSGEDVFDRGEDLGDMISLMKSFIFDYTGEDDMYEMIKENTNNFDHPYIMASDETFRYMSDVYEGRAVDETYKAWLDYCVEVADKTFEEYTTLPKNPANYTFKTKACITNPDKYKYLAFEITNPFYGIKQGEVWSDKPALGYDYCGPADENGDYWGKQGEHYDDGYDFAGSRNNYAGAYATKITQMALAYHITGDMKYAELGYDILVSLCDSENWHNWSHGHFLAVGEMLDELAPAYDWLYDAWVEISKTRGEDYSLTKLTNTIYRRTIYYGYDLIRYSRSTDVFVKKKEDDGFYNGVNNAAWNWSETSINWNCVCSSGLIMMCMAMVGEVQSDKLGAVYSDTKSDPGVDRVKWCMSNSLWKLAKFGLVQYAPDGSYIESASYWAYATNYLADLLVTVGTAVGDDMGLYETWGLDKTFYFAVQVEYSETKSSGKNGYTCWAYHDGSTSDQDTSAFFNGAQLFDDTGLAAIRMDHLNNLGLTELSWRDVILYKKEYSNLTAADADLSLDWELEACDGVVARSSWEAKSLFVGLLGGRNDFGNHAHMDSGMFTYANDGISWFPDLGSDEYNIYEYFGYGIRQHYYRMSTEGHNLVTITSLPDEMPFGQAYNGGGVVEKVYSQGKDGMYAILDNSGAYGTITNYARRGMLLTNSRTTTVIQDEIAFKGVQSCAWIAHTTANISLASDGRTAYLTKKVNGVISYLRVSLLSSNSKLKFKVMTCGVGEDDFIFDKTIRPGYSVANGQLPERDRSSYRRLVIEAENTLAFECAVVFESGYRAGDVSPVAYDYVQMSKWEVADSYKTDSDIGGGDDDNIITTAKMTDIKTYSAQAAKLLESGYAFSTRTVDFFKSLARVTVAVNTYRPESFKNIPQINDAYKAYLSQLEQYNAYREAVNKLADSSSYIAYGLSLV